MRSTLLLFLVGLVPPTAIGSPNTNFGLFPFADFRARSFMGTYGENSATDTVAQGSNGVTGDFVNFFGKHLIGTINLEGLRFVMDFSLTTSKSWQCDASLDRGCYNANRSSHFKNLSAPFHDKDVSGYWASDTFEVNGVVVKDQPFGVVDRIDWDWSIAFPALGIGPAVNRKSFLANIEDKLDRPIFSIWTQTSPPGQILANASFTLGAVDSKCSYSVSYTKALNPRWCGGQCWSVWLHSVTVDGPNGTFPIKARAKLDNVHGIYGPAEEIYKIAEFLNGKYDYEHRAFEVHCGSSRHDYPPIFFQVGLISLKLTAYDYIYETTDNRCFLAFLPGEMWGSGFAKYWIIGTPFFNSHCLVVNFKHNLIGFADLK